MFRLARIVCALKCEIVSDIHLVKRVPHFALGSYKPAESDKREIVVDYHAMKMDKKKRWRPSLKEPFVVIDPEKSKHAKLLEGLTDIGGHETALKEMRERVRNPVNIREWSQSLQSRFEHVTTTTVKEDNARRAAEKAEARKARLLALQQQGQELDSDALAEEQRREDMKAAAEEPTILQDFFESKDEQKDRKIRERKMGKKSHKTPKAKKTSADVAATS